MLISYVLRKRQPLLQQEAGAAPIASSECGLSQGTKHPARSPWGIGFIMRNGESFLEEGSRFCLVSLGQERIRDLGEHLITHIEIASFFEKRDALLIKRLSPHIVTQIQGHRACLGEDHSQSP